MNLKGLPCPKPPLPKANIIEYITDSTSWFANRKNKELNKRRKELHLAYEKGRQDEYNRILKEWELANTDL